MNLEELKNAVEYIKKTIPCYTEEDEAYHAQILIDLAESVLAVGAKMPEKKKHSDWDCGDAHCIVCEDRGYNRAIDDCRIAITGALLSEEELIDILNTLVHPTKKLPGTTVYCVPREVISTIATAIHSAQIEKLGGVR